MKNLIASLILIMSLTSCGETKKDPDLIIDITKIAGQEKEEVEKILGSPNNTESVSPSNTPCKEIPCEKCFYKNDKFEIVYINGKADWITINNVSDYELDKNTLQSIGLPLVEPESTQPNSLYWQYIENVKEINVVGNGNGMLDYIYIKSTTK
ncbi:hypothetical protein E0W68_09845 [Flavobacterium salilacus subsp. salilacus]|uniref:hypothetical protein n=1 Tax=Flavobacterium TaxID=237 RepID=UPI0010754422|nr:MULTISPECIES: hypothetical protein [Flavobacterium]KAF2518314.1 hypothetical protein E0W68_09845 [Flavobacterium salilacus subsp. salilacus]MBE1615272.1 hypothetical protein [Flavobacterium sp. SaA2.13]